MSDAKKRAAEAAIALIEDDMVIGVGTGTTVNYFIEALAAVKQKIDGCVASSVQTANRLKAAGIPVLDLNVVSELPLYVDGADEVTQEGQMIKGGGGALTREKIIAQVAKTFVCIADESKLVPYLGKFPVAVEVIPMARSYVARELVKLGADPEYREHFLTDNGNIILDLYNLKINTPIELEESINLISGVVDNGLFAKRRADIIYLGGESGVQTLEP